MKRGIRMDLVAFLLVVMGVSFVAGLIFLYFGVGRLHTDKHSTARVYILIGLGLLMLGLGFPLLAPCS